MKKILLILLLFNSNLFCASVSSKSSYNEEQKYDDDCNEYVICQQTKKLFDLLDAVAVCGEDDEIETIKKILNSKKVNVNFKDEQKFTPLILATKGGNSAIVELLLNAGANVNGKANEGYTALMEASEKGYKTIVALLLSFDAKVNEKNDDGMTALDLVSRRYFFYNNCKHNLSESDLKRKRDDCEEIIESLKKSGAQVNKYYETIINF